MKKIVDDVDEIYKIEVELLLEAVQMRYGYDFRRYSKSSIERRLIQFMIDKNCPNLSEVMGKLLRSSTFFYELLPYFTISVTALFRDAFFYLALREKVVPMLRTWPHFKVWHAGCATGEEAFSMAILLQEFDLLARATIYGTDISHAALETARKGMYSLEIIKQGSTNYRQAGGLFSLSNYYHAKYNAALLDPNLRKKITFSPHNLVIDKSFGEMQMIVCRNVLIYFNNELQDHVLKLFAESLEYGGYLCLGDKESLLFSSIADQFSVVDEKARIYKKIAMNDGYYQSIIV